MKIDYKEETLDYLKKVANVLGDEIAQKFKCEVLCNCGPAELEDGRSVIHLEFAVIEPEEE